ncbi:DKNYY domain-containing protein [Aquimarina litoralis]|uniref:DKNYY domain-containing protein n=1 Tax=Aquimarina litoralis TaxID=584605 RepID=UPI001C562274|nr:DKNYY domain-containing protein [Aquimarina litoralis]MBW1295041.1 hypothetical protein [Aquimarina litoralis]
MKVLQIIGIIIAVMIGITIVYYAVAIALFSWVSSPSTNGAKIINKELSNQYYYKENTIVFVQGANFFSLGARKIKNVDYETFEVLANNLGKDKNHVYFNEKVLEGAQPKTFEIISTEKTETKYQYHYYFKDTTTVYYFRNPIKGANPATFQYLWGDFSKDTAAIFYQENRLSTLNDTVYSIKNDIKGNYVRVNDSIYYKDLLVQTIDAKNFEVITENFATDKKAIYFQNHILKDIDPESFTVLNSDYQKDKNHLYYKTQIISDSDPDSYQFISTLFSRDKNNLYYIGKKVMNPDFKKYSINKIRDIESSYHYRTLSYDEDHIIFVRKKELIELSKIHSIYKEEIYALNNRIKKADYKSFKVYENSEDLYAKDHKQVYYLSSIIHNADISSFEIINSQFSKDKNHVYYLEKRLLDIHPDTFIYQEGMYGESIDSYSAKLIYP